MSAICMLIIALSVLTLAIVLSSVLTSLAMRKKVSYMLDALEDKELNFRFDEHRLFSKKFNRTLNRLRAIFDKERQEISDQERSYGLMLDHVKTGVVVVDTGGRVTYGNKTALSILGLATFSHIRQLKSLSEALFLAFKEVSENGEERAEFFNETGKVCISLTASQAMIGGKTLRILAFNDISNEMAENEQQSWSKLIRVLTHEIMNTITPIASLSETLLKFEDLNEETKSGLNTISQSSRGLIKFVNSYRDLTRVAAPVKKVFVLKDMVERIISLTKEEFTEAYCQCVYLEKSEEVLLYADEGQISQIFVNLMKNAVQAGASLVKITAEIDLAENVVINVFNNGRPISKESQDEIFVPFYTTKPEGTGIGLSLSRQIMRLHDGNLRLLRSDEKGTVFQLIFK